MNHLFYGDNLGVLRESIADASVDLIYLDPPFNSNASYNVLFKDESGRSSGAQIEAFDDTWHWDDMVSGQAVAEVRDSPYQNAAAMLDAMLGFLGKNPMTAYLAMMAVRLIELHRVLKPTGSLYLHCDPTASHYLKILLDAVFGETKFQNEIIWSYRRWPTRARQFQRMHDTILFYTKSLEPGVFNTIYQEASESSKKRWKGKKQKVTFDSEGNRNPTLETDETSSVPINSVWPVPLIAPSSKERLGYPTQKPVALLERIISASSNPGDVVLDPFCGCGTTVHAAEKLGREWIGIDITHVAITLIETRLFDAFEGRAQFRVHGVPKDVAGAQDLFNRDDRTKKEFEKWAVGLIKAYPQAGGKKGADGGIDGLFRFGRDKEHKAIVSVKGGRNLGVGMIRDLDAVVTEQSAQIGVFLTLHNPTKPMRDWAAKAGTFRVEGFDPVPRIQIVTIADALRDGPSAVQAPLRHGSPHKKAAPERDPGAQGSLGL
jgi:DNA modification methylase